MSQNTSSAVMQQRNEPSDSLDLFPTQPWATRALCEQLENRMLLAGSKTCWEPACGFGDMVKPLREYFSVVHASDVHDYGWEGQDRVSDFLFHDSAPPHIKSQGVDWIITNPPFRLAEDFAHVAFGYAHVGIAFVVRLAFLEGIGRYANLFSQVRPALILQFTERVPMVKGRLAPDGSTATAYCWIVWTKNHTGPTIFDWIPPCRKRLERPEDYQRQAV